MQGLQVYGDSKLITNLTKGAQICTNIRLVSLLEEVLMIKNNFDEFSCHHVYKERNIDADQLSKTAFSWISDSGML